MNKHICTIVMILLLSTIVTAQEYLAPEEIFRWIPEENYSEIHFYNYKNAVQMPGFQKYYTFQKSIERTISPWVSDPFHLEGQVLSSLSAYTADYQVETKRDSKRGMNGSFTMGDKTYFYYQVGFNLKTLRYPPELDLGKAFLNNPAITKTEIVLNYLPVYHFASQGKRNNQSCFFCITYENEVISSSKLEFLEKMVETGSGTEPSFLETFGFAEAIDLLPTLGQEWGLYDNSLPYKAIYKKMVENKADNHLLDELQQHIDKEPLIILSNDFSSAPTDTRITFFKDEQDANNYYSSQAQYWHKKNPRFTRGNISQYTHLNTTIKKEKNMVVDQLIMTPEYMDHFKKLWEERLTNQEKTK